MLTKKVDFGKMFRAHHIFKEDNNFLLNSVNKYRAYLKTFAISIKYTWISKEDEYSFYKKKEVLDFTYISANMEYIDALNFLMRYDTFELVWRFWK